MSTVNGQDLERAGSRFVDDDHAIAFPEVNVVFLSFVEVVQSSDDQLSCQSNQPPTTTLHLV